MKKLLWVMAALFVSFAVSAQNRDDKGRIIINSAEEFLKIGTTGYPSDGKYIQTANIDLGYRSVTSPIISGAFSGTYDGDGYSISYKATFEGSGHNHGSNNGDYALFGYVNGGTLRNMSVSGEVLLTANGANDMNVALLCGHSTNATIDHCNVAGSVSTYVNAQNGGGADAALLIGQADNTEIKYCSGSGNVVGVGWVGGLIGSCPSGTIKACTFSGQVEAIQPIGNNNNVVVKGYGGFAGGIVGMAGKTGDNVSSAGSTVTINLCYVNADITAGQVASGIASVAVGAGTATVTNSCAEGTLTGNTTNGNIPQGSAASDITNSTTHHMELSNTHDSNNKTVDELERIVEALNGRRPSGEKAVFDVVDGHIVLYLDGKPAEPCAAVTDLTIRNVAPGSLTCSWTAGGSETAWSVSISGGDLTEDITRNVTTDPIVTIEEDARLTTSQNNYVLSVVAKCSETSLSVPATSSFVISCPTITGMNVTPDYTSATVVWTTNTDSVKAELFQGETLKETQVIPSEQPHTYTFDTLTPNTTYKVRLSAKCGGDYVGATERVFTTPSLPIVSGLTTAPSYDGTIQVVNQRGAVTVSWNVYTPALSANDDRYEVEIVKISSNSNIATAQITDTFYTKSQIDTGSYTVRVRVKYGDRYSSDWTDEYPFVISNPNAPKNPTWTLTRNENNSYDVTVTWTKGNEWTIDGNNTQYWKVNSNDSIPGVTDSSNYRCVFTSVVPGSDWPVSIVEYQATKTGEKWSVTNTSSPLSFTIPIPCFEIETPTAGAITQTSATLSGLRSGYVVVLSDGTNTTNYPASGETLSETLLLTGLTPATHYTAEVRNYCTQEKYSSKTVEFTTVGCYSPTNVKVTDITPLQAKVSWTQGNPHLGGLLFKYKLEEEINETYIQIGDSVEGYSGISKTFTNLKPATTYRVSVAEQCGTDYGIPTTITFTTSPGNFVAISNGSWGSKTTWQDGLIPNGIGTITINSGVTVTLDRTLVLTENYTLTNNGTLLINNGELVNTTDNNDLGNVRISFTATQNKWKFIGAPFTSSQDRKYRLESIEPVSGSDVAVVLYNYQSGVWSNNWATINDRVPQAEGFFAWPFYSGTITFNNDYNTDGTVDYSLNNSDITVTRDVITSTSSNPNGNWMSLANPYPAELDIARFLSDNSEADLQSGLQGDLQGEVVYIFNGSSFGVKNIGSLPICEGFFVNFSNSGNNSVTFHKTQMTSYPSGNNTKSKTAQNPWIEMSLVNKRDKVKFFFAHNPLAEQGYDKYDANKLFATTGVAEPYFVTDGMNLVKEEVKELPYYATLNVRSEQDTLMTFVADKIPEGYRVSLIDGEQTIEMNEGSRYETNISAGENADRFKLLIQNNVGLNQVSQTDITITNSNRHVAISAEAISNVEVFNALGQRVYQTKASTFTLSGVQSGVYVVRVSTAKGTKSQKIVVE
ncbi:MAG: fibronectin type III domain-containing protein [Bacteroidales bacterium]|nr:fibronectin type III domain-containing protein [Bacteroidales bacterium]